MFVAYAFLLKIDELEKQWMSYSWDSENPTKEILLKLKSEAITLQQFLTSKKEYYEQIIGGTP